jgi:hypothetical protein
MKRTYRYITDPGHGWLEVNFIDLVNLGILQDISGCSYIQAKTPKNIKCYLEEDCDMAIYLDAYKAKYGKLPIIKDLYLEHCWIRNLNSIADIQYLCKDIEVLS